MAARTQGQQPDEQHAEGVQEAPAPVEVDVVTGKTARVGAIWAVPAADGDRVEVTTPSGLTFIVVAAQDLGALVALAEPGRYTSGEHAITAKG